MKNISLGSLLAAALLAYSSCDCPPMFTLEEEKLQSPFQVESFSLDNGVYISFNKPVEAASLGGLKTLLIGGGNTKYTGYFELSPDHLYVFIPQCEIFCNASQSVCPFTLRLDGDIADGMAVRSEGGQILDGDQNGSDGGDFSRYVDGFFDCGLYTLTVDSATVSYFPPNSQNEEVRIDIVFNTNVDTTSVQVGENVYLECADNPSVKETGSIIWLSRNKMRFTAAKDRNALFPLCFVGDFSFFNFIIKGTAPQPVKSVYGSLLENGKDYKFQFSM